MNGVVFLRNACKTWTKHRRSISDLSIGAPFPTRHNHYSYYHYKHIQSRPFCRVPDVLRKAAKETIVLDPSLVNSKIGFGFVSWYLGMIKTRPVLTKSVTSSIIYVAADVSSQTIAKPFSEPYDLLRTLRMATYGMLVLGPTLHYWFNFVSRVFPKRDLLSTMKKIVMGQTSYGPAMTVIFFSWNARLQGENSGEIIARLKRDLVPTLINGAMYWPICDFITFRFIPVHLQPLVSNSFSYLWTVYVTYMASLEKASTPA